MKRFLAIISILLTFMYITQAQASDTAETSITLMPGLNVISTPALLKGISFSNSGNNITFATLQNHKRHAVTINNNNVGEVFTPLTGFIVRNDTAEDVTMTLSYNTNVDESGIFLEKKLDDGRNLLGITTRSNPFENIANATATTILDLTNGAKNNKVVTGNNFETATGYKLGKSYGVYINQTGGLYSGKSNNESLEEKLSQAECQELCEYNDYDCPDECRSGILSKNTTDNTTIYLNNDVEQTIYSGFFTTNKSLEIDSIYLYGDNSIPAGDELTLYIYMNNEELLELTLFNEISSDIQAYRRDGPKNINTGQNNTFKIMAKYTGTTKNIDYNYKFKILGNIDNYYEINSQNINFYITGEKKQEPQYNTNFINAYNRANNLGILENQTIDYYNLNEGINNADLTSFMNNYTKNILDREIDTGKDCSYINTESLSETQINAVIESCKLGLIQQDDNIDRNNQSDLSTFSILLSRALWKERYNGGNYISTLKTAGILTNTDPEYNELKGDILVALMNSEGKNEYRRISNSYSFLMDDFNAVEDIYKDIRTSDGDRVIYIVRHSARENNCGENGGLTQNGMNLAIGVGDKLKGEPFTDTSTDFYGSSYTKRTVQTSYYVGKGRGNENLNNNILLSGDERRNYEYVNHDNTENGIVKFVYGNYFSDGINVSHIEHLYEKNKETTNKRALNAIYKLCNITKGHPFSWIASHDRYTLPITERATDENLTFHLSTYDRPNFMQGVAIIVHEYGGREIYPVKSLETGKMDGRNNPGCS